MCDEACASVAVCYTGWLNVTIPERGAGAKTHLIDVLKADVFLAATYLPGDCPDGGGGCLLDLVSGLQPLTSLELKPMLTREQLRRMVSVAPHWHNISTRYRKHHPKGLSLWSPVLGNPGLSVLRELHDYSRVFELLRSHERQRTVLYERVVFARLEMRWFAPHPPLALMDASKVWLPFYTGRGLNDRQAVLNRSVAGIYFRRFELMLSPESSRLQPDWVLLQGHPEDLLESTMRAHELPLRFYPQTAALACCRPGFSKCFTYNCIDVTLPSASAHNHVAGAASTRPTRPRLRSSLQPSPQHVRRALRA